MNANEVIAALAGDDVHATTTSTWARARTTSSPRPSTSPRSARVEHDLLPALETLAMALEQKSQQLDDVVKSGRTHLMDAVPVTLGQEFAGYAAQVRQGIERVRDSSKRLGQIPLGGTAVGRG